MSTMGDTSQKPHLCFFCKSEFTDPTDKPCGHDICKSCIKEHFRIDIPSKCPVCKTVINPTPDRGMFADEKAAYLSQLVQQSTTSSSSSEKQPAKPGEVPCDVCTGSKMKALKSCLDCLVSYCETHLDTHLTTPGLKRHQLIEPEENLKRRMCEKHNKLLELFCENDQMCLCTECFLSDHRNHIFVSLKEEYEGKKVKLGKTEAEIKQMIQERQLKIQQFKRSVELSDKEANREMAEGVKIFKSFKECVERSQTKFVSTIMEKQRTTKRQAEGFITELQQEISQLEKRISEVEQLSRSEDHLHLLQNFTSLKAAPPTKNWTGVSIQKPLYKGTWGEAVQQLEETLKDQMKKAQMRMFQQYEVDVTLDPDTANSSLILSHCQKQVYWSDSSVYRPYQPGRFLTSPCVLAKQGFSSGVFYYEVEVKGCTSWDLGVARESINRQRTNVLSPQNGFWTLILRNGNTYDACADPPIRLCLQSQPEKVGVLVDYEEGGVLFVDVDAAALIYAFSGCSFTEKLYPYFSPSFQDGLPMTITPVASGTRGVSLRAQRPLLPLLPLSPPDLLCNLSLSK